MRFFSNSYVALTDQAIEVTCERLIDRVVEQLDKLDKAKMDTDAGAGEEDDDELECDELMERLVIEEFGKCLERIINTAENRKS